MNTERESQLSRIGFAVLAAAVCGVAVVLAVAVTLLGSWWM